MEGIEAAAFQHNWASSSTPSDPSPTAMTPVVARPNEFLMMDYSQLDMEECLLMFYSKFYPFDRIYRWLSYGIEGFYVKLMFRCKGAIFYTKGVFNDLGQSNIHSLPFLFGGSGYARTHCASKAHQD